MKNNLRPLPDNEFERLLQLSDFDLDYTNLQHNFKDLNKLAAKVAGTEISLVNLIDTFTQWTISNYGMELTQMPRENSVCQYTIMESDHFEVIDMSLDDRFKNQSYVKDNPQLKYYFGVPLKLDGGLNLGALCLLDKEKKVLSPEKIELLKIIADEIVNRFRAIRAIHELENNINEIRDSHKKVAHDIRGPIGGIISLAQIIKDQGDQNKLEEVLQYIHLIQKSGSSLLQLTDEILTLNYDKPGKGNASDHYNSRFNLSRLGQKVIDMYAPLALEKNIRLEVKNLGDSQDVNFPKNKLMQLIGNLVSNALKFTPSGGSIKIVLNLSVKDDHAFLKVDVEDSGKGVSVDKRNEILYGEISSTNGTRGEKGYGFGLELVKHLLKEMKGALDITSISGQGSTFKLVIPL